MLIQQLFDQLGNAQDILAYFEGVTTPQQLASRFETLKRGENPLEFFDDLEALRISTTNALSANIELGGTLGSDEEGDAVDDILDGLEGFTDNDPDISEPSKTPKDETSPTNNASDKPSL
jgi:hypothetical protein